jgi:hypothetical protein
VSDPPFDWKGDTTPFTDEHGDIPATFVLEQVSTNDFRLTVPFRYTAQDGRRFAVTDALLGPTDVASVPTFLGWFARRQGDHTPAALLHDQLITSDPGTLPPEQRLAPVDANLLFREALTRSGNPTVKTWLMWTAVTLRTRYRAGGVATAAIVVWFAAALGGTVAVIAGLTGAGSAVTAVALVAPVPFALLWGAQWRAGLVAGYAFWLVVAGSLPAFLAYQAYRVAELVVLGVRWLKPDNRGPDAPPLAAPPKYSER